MSCQKFYIAEQPTAAERPRLAARSFDGAERQTCALLSVSRLHDNPRSALRFAQPSRRS